MCGNGGTYSRQQRFILVIIGSVHFASAICTSLQSPFYPIEAESKNATATEYGFVFGIYELVSFVCSPLLGNFIDQIGAKFLLNTGIFTAAICSILFGLLDLVSDHASFLTLSFAVRMVEAIGSSAAVTSAFAITAASFPDNVGSVFATLEIFYGLGYIVGPTLGGIFYSLGGYMLPFMVMGTVLLIDGLAILIFLPSFRTDSQKTKAKLLDILKVPAVLLDSFSIASVSMCMGFYAATLEPHIREFNLTPVALGFVFIVHGATYSLTAPFVGRLNDTCANPRYVILLGSVLTILSVTLVGPAPFIPVDTSLLLVIIGLVALGLAMTCILVSAFVDAIRSAVSAGFPDDISTYGLVAGLWASSFSLGDFIGPSVAGFLEDLVGFRWGTLFITFTHIILFTSMLIFILRKRSRAPEVPTHLRNVEPRLLDNLKENEPLLVTANFKENEYGSARNGSTSITLK